MKKIYLYALVFIALLVALYFIFQQNNSKTSLTSSASAFTVENTEELGKIFIADRTGQTATLTRKEGTNEWLYGGKHLVRKQAMENLLKTLESVRVRYVVPEAAMQTALTQMGTDGIKVELYDLEDKKMKVFYVGGGTSDNQGTYMLMEGAEQPYVVHIPLWEGILTPRFMVAERDWRDRAIFRENFENIEAVSFNYPLQKKFSFKMEKEGKDYKVEPYYQTTPIINEPIIQGKAQRFLIGFTELIAEAYQNDYGGKGNIIQKETPFVIINISRTDGSTKEVSLYPIDDTFMGNNPNAENTLEKYFVLLKEDDNQDFMLGQHRVLRRILWAYDFFFTENEQ